MPTRKGAGHFSSIHTAEVCHEQILPVVSSTDIVDRSDDGKFQSGANESGHGSVDDMDEEA
jgi:hypothetical protein